MMTLTLALLLVLGFRVKDWPLGFQLDIMISLAEK